MFVNDMPRDALPISAGHCKPAWSMPCAPSHLPSQDHHCDLRRRDHSDGQFCSGLSRRAHRRMWTRHGLQRRIGVHRAGVAIATDSGVGVHPYHSSPPSPGKCYME